MPQFLRFQSGIQRLSDHVDLVGRIDSVHARIRNKFEMVPDAPVSRFELTMQGGEKGLLVNNTELCRTTPRANVRFVAQNGKTHHLSPGGQGRLRQEVELIGT